MTFVEVCSKSPFALSLIVSAVAFGQTAPQNLPTRHSLGKLAYERFLRGSLVSSPDGSHVAYVGIKDDKYFVVRDGVVQKEFESAILGTTHFSPDSQHFCYAAGKGGDYRLYLDGIGGRSYAQIVESSVIFSPDSRRVAYVAADRGAFLGLGQSGACFYVVDGKEVKRHSALMARSLSFSGDSAHYVYIAGVKGSMSVVVDGKEGRHYGEIPRLLINRNGSHVAYFVKDKKESFLVYDSVESKLGFEAVLDPAENAAFSQDGSHFGYVGKRSNGQTFVVVDGVPNGPYQLGKKPAFNCDGSRIIYIASALGAEKQSVVDNGVTGPEFDEIDPESLTFSPDGKRFCYSARIGRQRFLIMDGVRLPQPFDAFRRVTFSPDSKQYALLAESDGRRIVFRNGVPGSGYASVLPRSLRFSTDGEHLMYFAGRGDTYFLVVDGVEDTPYSLIVSTEPSLTGSNSVRFVGLTEKDDELFCVEVPLVPTGDKR